jgi:hypothetical protein
MGLESEIGRVRGWADSLVRYKDASTARGISKRDTRLARGLPPSPADADVGDLSPLRGAR